MARLRRNHKGRDRSGFAGMMVRVIVFFLFTAVVFVFLYRGLNRPKNQDVHSEEMITDAIAPEDRIFLPTSTTGQVVHHNYYSLSYSEKYEQAEWVAYMLTKESIRVPNVPRSRRFNIDPLVHTGSATHWDYKGSLMTRGHLAPAGDMAFNQEAMEESFYMSNISPQRKEFNEGIWRDLEELVRDWAWNEGEIIVVTGPVLEHVETWIGKKNKIGVPKSFYKVILTNGKGPSKAIALIVPHAVSSKPLSSFIVSIDEVERRTGIDFFSKWLTDDEEQILEADSTGRGFTMQLNRR